MTNYGFPEPQGTDFKSNEFVYRSDAVVSCDWHLPFFSTDWANKVIDASRTWNVRTAIFAGDTFDFNYVSKYRKHREDKDNNLNIDFVVGREWAKVIFKWFDTAIFLPGSHDERLIKALDENLDYQTLLQMIVPEKYWECMTVIERPYMVLQSGEQEWRITHPASYSKSNLKVANHIAMRKKQNVIMAHSHRFSMGRSEDDAYVVVDCGGIFDEKKMGYRYLEGDSTYNEWVNGFVVVKNGKIIPYSAGIGY